MIARPAIAAVTWYQRRLMLDISARCVGLHRHLFERDKTLEMRIQARIWGRG